MLARAEGLGVRVLDSGFKDIALNWRIKRKAEHEVEPEAYSHRVYLELEGSGQIK